MKRISVIVPVYNCREYLPDLAASLLEQDWEDLRLIFSDDGSTDGSLEYLRELARQDPRVTVTAGENAGVSAARNRALMLADGDYIGFCDADDTVDPGYLRALALALEESGADMACCGFTRRYARSGAGDGLPGLGHVREITDREGMTRLLLRPDGYTTVMWNKLFRREALLDKDGSFLRFDESLHIVEDGEFILRTGVRTAVFLPDRLYHYVVRNSGAMYGRITDRKLTELKARRMIVDLTEGMGPETRDLARMKYQKGVRDLLLHAVIDGDAKAVRPLKPRLRIWARELFASPALSRKEKLKYHVYRPIITLELRRTGRFLMDHLSGH